jgi:hypothetical protein
VIICHSCNTYIRKTWCPLTSRVKDKTWCMYWNTFRSMAQRDTPQLTLYQYSVFRSPAIATIGPRVMTTNAGVDMSIHVQHCIQWYAIIYSPSCEIICYCQIQKTSMENWYLFLNYISKTVTGVPSLVITIKLINGLLNVKRSTPNVMIWWELGKIKLQYTSKAEWLPKQ